MGCVLFFICFGFLLKLSWMPWKNAIKQAAKMATELDQCEKLFNREEEKKKSKRILHSDSFASIFS